MARCSEKAGAEEKVANTSCLWKPSMSSAWGRFVKRSGGLASRRRLLRRDGGDPTPGGLGVVFAHERESPRIQRPDREVGLAVGGDQLLDHQIAAVELLGGRVLVDQHDVD